MTQSVVDAGDGRGVQGEFEGHRNVPGGEKVARDFGVASVSVQSHGVHAARPDIRRTNAEF